MVDSVTDNRWENMDAVLKNIMAAQTTKLARILIMDKNRHIHDMITTEYFGQTELGMAARMQGY